MRRSLGKKSTTLSLLLLLCCCAATFPGANGSPPPVLDGFIDYRPAGPILPIATTQTGCSLVMVTALGTIFYKTNRVGETTASLVAGGVVDGAEFELVKDVASGNWTGPGTNSFGGSTPAIMYIQTSNPIITLEETCNNRGSCSQDSVESAAYCVCEIGYKGTECEIDVFETANYVEIHPNTSLGNETGLTAAFSMASDTENDAAIIQLHAGVYDVDSESILPIAGTGNASALRIEPFSADGGEVIIRCQGVRETALFVVEGEFHLINVTARDCFKPAAQGAVITNTGTSAVIYIEGSTLTNNTGLFAGVVAAVDAKSLTIKDTIISNNTGASKGLGYGGALYSTGTRVDLDTVTFIGNKAGLYGGAMYITRTGSSRAGFLTLRDSVFVENSAEYMGGAVYLNNDQYEISNTRFERNTCYIYPREGSRMLVSGYYTLYREFGGNGGAMVLADSLGTFTNATFTGNTAENSGGAIFYVSSSTSHLQSCTFENNSALRSGGAIALSQSGLSVTQTVVESNRASYEGGAISAVYSYITMLGASLIGNSADLDGGAIFLRQSTVEATLSTIVGNTATRRGGAVDLVADSYMGGTSVSLVRNSCTNGDGGGISLKDNAAVNFTTLICEGNSAKGYGGCFDVRQSEATLISSTITDNLAGYGAGFLIFRGIVSLQSVVFEGNSAQIAGGAVFQGDTRSETFVPFQCTSCVYSNQTAQYGANFATHAVQIIPVSPLVSVQKHGEIITPTVRVSLVDLYGQQVVTDQDTRLTARMVETPSLHANANVLAGETSVLSVDGATAFTTLGINGKAGGLYSMVVEGILSNPFDTLDSSFSQSAVIQFVVQAKRDYTDMEPGDAALVITLFLLLVFSVMFSRDVLKLSRHKCLLVVVVSAILVFLSLALLTGRFVYDDTAQYDLLRKVMLEAVAAAAVFAFSMYILINHFLSYEPIRCAVCCHYIDGDTADALEDAIGDMEGVTLLKYSSLSDAVDFLPMIDCIVFVMSKASLDDVDVGQFIFAAYEAGNSFVLVSNESKAETDGLWKNLRGALKMMLINQPMMRRTEGWERTLRSKIVGEFTEELVDRRKSFDITTVKNFQMRQRTMKFSLTIQRLVSISASTDAALLVYILGIFASMIAVPNWADIADVAENIIALVFGIFGSVLGLSLAVPFNFHAITVFKLNPIRSHLSKAGILLHGNTFVMYSIAVILKAMSLEDTWSVWDRESFGILCCVILAVCAAVHLTFVGMWVYGLLNSVVEVKQTKASRKYTAELEKEKPGGRRISLVSSPSISRSDRMDKKKKKTIFISYKHADTEFASKLNTDLKSLGYDTWIDSMIEAGEYWKQQVAEAIEKSCLVIFIGTPDAVQSKYCQEEILYASDMKKRIQPLTLRPWFSDLQKMRAMHMVLAPIQFIDFEHSHDEGMAVLTLRLATIMRQEG